MVCSVRAYVLRSGRPARSVPGSRPGRPNLADLATHEGPPSRDAAGPGLAGLVTSRTCINVHGGNRGSAKPRPVVGLRPGDSRSAVLPIGNGPTIRPRLPVANAGSCGAGLCAHDASMPVICSVGPRPIRSGRHYSYYFYHFYHLLELLPLTDGFNGN